MVAIAGILLLAFGLVSGAILALAPFKLLPAEPGLMLWVLFPLFSVLGYLLFVVPASVAHIRTVSRIAGAGLLLLAMIAACGLMLVAAALVAPGADTAPLWYVLAIGMVLGSTGLLSHRSAAGDAR